MTTFALTGFVNALIAVALARLPGLRERWEILSSEAKSMWIGILLVVTAAGFTALSCAGIGFDGYTVSCTQAGVVGVVTQIATALLGGLAGSQGTYLVAVQPYKKAAA